jgi:CubicO group peptidase (beta-lactamase class C family)
MKWIVRILCVNFLTCVPAFGAVHPFPRELDAYIEKARRDWNVPGLAIAIVDGEGVVAAKGYGVRRLGQPTPWMPTHGSISHRFRNRSTPR